MNSLKSSSSTCETMSIELSSLSETIEESSPNYRNLLESFFSLVSRNNEILIMPKMVFDCGLVGSLIVLLGVAILAYITNMSLCHCAKKTNSSSLMELNSKIFPKSVTIFNIFFITFLIGNIICNQALIAETLSLTLSFIYGESVWANRLVLTLIISSFPLFFIFSKTVYKIKFLSNFAMIAFYLGVFVIVKNYFYPLPLLPHIIINENQQINFWNFKGILSNIGIYFLSFTLHDVLIDFSSELKPQTIKRTRTLLVSIIGTILVNFIICSFFGYMALYKDTSSSSMDNFISYILLTRDHSDSLIVWTNYIVSLNFLFDCLISIIPISKFIDSLFTDSNESRFSLSSIPYKANALKIFFVAWIALINIAVVLLKLDVQGVFEMISSISVIPIFIGFPLLWYNQCFPESLGNGRLLIYIGFTVVMWLVLLFGCLMYL